ncbi:MAG: YggS family pyridoxal phosphate-dependent enzyme [Actinomycetia bacterium]|nr:YggS family pyridoxal phosphate-dependent enzyme [Actinomycetes bacterium]
MSAELAPAPVIAERYEAMRAELGADVTIVVATKYVPQSAMHTLAAAGITTVGENRLQDLEAKHAELGSAFAWHFIGHLQSRKAPAVSAQVELVHSLDSLSAAKRLRKPALVQVNLAGERSKSGVGSEEVESFVAQVTALGVDVRGLTTMPPATADPEASRPYFRRLAEIAASLGLEWLSMGTSQDYRVAAQEGATHVRVGAALFGLSAGTPR